MQAAVYATNAIMLIIMQTTFVTLDDRNATRDQYESKFQPRVL